MKTFIDLKNFEVYAGSYLNRNTGETKLGVRIIRAFKIISGIFIAHAEQENDIRRDFSYTEKKGEIEVIVRDANGSYIYTKASEKTMVEAIRQLKNKPVVVDFSACYILEMPEGLNESEIDAFNGIVLSPEMAEEMKNKFV